MNTNETQIPESVPQQENPVPAARRAYSTAFSLPALLFFVTIIVVFLLLQLIDTSKSLALEYIISFIPMYAVAFPCCVLAARRVPKMPPEKHSLSPVRIFLYFLCIQFMSLFGNFIGIVVNAFLSLLLGVQTSATFLQNGVYGEQSLLFCLIAVLCAPVFEELVFRKLIIDRIRQYGNGTAILISGLLFGLFHGNFTQFFYATMIGLLLAYIYTRTGKIHYTIILHMMLNFWGTFMPLIVTRNIDKQAFLQGIQESMDALQKYLTTGQPIDEASIQLYSLLGDVKPLIIYAVLNYALAFAGLIILIVRKKHFKLDAPVTPLPKGRHLSAVFINFGTLFAAAVCIFQFVNQIYGII